MNLVGTTVDPDEVFELLGQGGFGAVHRARHRVLGTEVALKVLWPDQADDPTHVQRFLQEARAAAAIGSPYIVAVSDAGQTADGVVYLAMELLRGLDLRAELRERGALPLREAVALGLELLAGLIAAHDAGIIHRDLKPGNIFLAETPEGRRVKLLDFGISKVRGAKTLTAAGMVLGTPQYMAPEQLEGSRQLDHRADLFSLGCILYELITSEVPIPGRGYEVILKRVQGLRPPDIRERVPSIPPQLADVVMRALAFDPDARWPDARTMQAALRSAGAELGGGPPSTAPRPRDSAPTTPLHTLAPRAARYGLPVAIGVMACLLAAGGGLLSVLGYRLYDAKPAARERPVAVNALPVPIEPPPPSSTVPVVVPLPSSGPSRSVVPQARAVASTAPPPPESVRWRITQFSAQGYRSAVRSAVESALPDIARCATDRPLHLAVSIMFTSGSVQNAAAHPTLRSDDREAADCAAAAIRRQEQWFSGVGTVDFAIELPARGSR